MTDYNFAYNLVEFMAGLHDCHVCKYPIQQINGRGKKRTYCSKYKMPINKVRGNCIDRFAGFNKKEMINILKQHKTEQARQFLCENMLHDEVS